MAGDASAVLSEGQILVVDAAQKYRAVGRGWGARDLCVKLFLLLGYDCIASVRGETVSYCALRLW